MEASILLWIQDHLRNDFLTPIMSKITFLGDLGWFWIILALILLVIGLIKRKNYNRAGENPWLVCACAALLAMLISFLVGNVFLKKVVDRTRPYDSIPELILLAKKPHDASFPSGHTTFSFACAAALLYTVPKKQRWTAVLLLVLACLIGFSRLYLGVHYPTDVLGGLIVGWLCAWISAAFINRKMKKA